MVSFKKEQFKTILLVFLILMSMMLAHQLWMDVPLWRFLSSKPSGNMELGKKEGIVNISDAMSPQSITVNFGGGLHTVLYADAYGLWEKVLQILQEKNATEIDIQEVDALKWKEAQNVKSIEMKFACRMPIEILSKGIQGAFKDKIAFADSILLLLIENNPVYMADSQEEKYYRLASSKGIQDELIEKVNQIESKEYTHYYPIEDIYGVSNYRLMPVEWTESLPEIKTVPEMDAADDLGIKSFAGTFFGENFDFVRKIRETTGSVIYTYGYGKKSLKINSLGVAEYIEEIDPQKTAASVGVWEAFQIAFQFVQEHGGWTYSDGNSIKPFIKNIVPVEREKRKGYRFIFGYRFNDVPVYHPPQIAGEALEVEVIGSQVNYYKRFLKEKASEAVYEYERELEYDDGLEMMVVTDIINKNFDVIEKDYLRNQGQNIKEMDEEKIRDEILESMDSIGLGYYDQSAEKIGVLGPVWILKVGNITYYFDVYDGSIVSRFEN